MRFLVDVSPSPRVAKWLRGEDHDTVHLFEHGLERLADGEVFAKAVAEKRVLLSRALDFAEIRARSANERVGVVIFRVADARASRLVSRLPEVLREAAPALERSAVVVVEEARLRVRLKP